MALYKIDDLEKKHPNWFSADSELTYDEQKWIWENLPLSEEDEHRLEQIPSTNKKDENVLNGSVNGTYKLQENLTENQSKSMAIANLQKSRVKETPIKDVACWLEDLFGIWQEKPLHWIFIAEHYTPKSINSVINEMRKRKERGGMPLNKPGAYFTKILKRYHPQRKLPKRKD